MKVLQLVGKYMDSDINKIKDNLKHALYVAAFLRRGGLTVLVPHIESFAYSNILTEHEWVEHSIATIKCIDGIVMLDNVADSKGAQLEVEAAIEYGKEIYTIEEILAYLKKENEWDTKYCEECDYSRFKERLDQAINNSILEFLIVTCPVDYLENSFIVQDTLFYFDDKCEEYFIRKNSPKSM